MSSLTHGEQSVPYEWGVAKVDGQEYLVRDKPEGMAELYAITGQTRNVRTLIQSDAVIFGSKVLEPRYNHDHRSVELHHDHAGNMYNLAVDEWLEEPSFQLESVHIATHILDYPEDTYDD